MTNDGRLVAPDVWQSWTYLIDQSLVLDEHPSCGCRSGMGKPKVMYESRADACAFLSQSEARFGTGRAYRCATSRAWHVTYKGV